MKTSFRVFRVACVALTLVSLAACTSTGYKRGDIASQSLLEAAHFVERENRAIDTTMAALNDLVNKPTGDLRPQFAQFSRNLDQLEAAARRADASGLRMQKNHHAYFRAWDDQLTRMNYDAVREGSQARRQEVARQFDATWQRFEENQAALQPFIDYLRDIQQALKADLTADGLASVRGVVSNANANAGKLQTALNQMVASLNSSSGRLSSVVLEASK